MSSRPPSPVHPNPNLTAPSPIYRNFLTTDSSAMAATQLPPPIPHVFLPSPSSAMAGPQIPPPSHLQPAYVPTPPQMRLGYSDFANRRSHVYPLPRAISPQPLSKEHLMPSFRPPLHSSPYAHHQKPSSPPLPTPFPPASERFSLDERRYHTSALPLLKDQHGFRTQQPPNKPDYRQGSDSSQSVPARSPIAVGSAPPDIQVATRLPPKPPDM